MVKKVVIDKADRLFQLPPDIFSFAKSESRKQLIKKSNLIDLGRFNWPVESEDEQIPARSVTTPASAEKINKLKEDLLEWSKTVLNAKVTSPKEIFIGGGISSIVYLSSLAFIDCGDLIFIPDTAIPLYKKAVTICGGEPVGYQISAKNEWQPSWDKINSRLGRVARLMYINNPHNPSGSILREKNLEELIWLAGKENITVVCDAAYQGIGNQNIPSLLSIKNGKKTGLEIHSFAYRFGLPHIPLGFAIGHRDIISGLEQAVGLIPGVIPEYHVDLALDAIRRYPSENIDSVKKHIRKSEAECLKFIDKLGLEQAGYSTTPFLWAKIEKRRSSNMVANQLYRRYRILTAPGAAFGDSGEGYLRFSLTASAEDFQNASKRIKKRLSLLKGEET